MVRQYFELAIVSNKHPFLLELIEVSESIEALLWEWDEADIVHGTVPLTHKKWVFLERQFVEVECVEIRPILIRQDIVIWQITKQVSFALVEILTLLFGCFAVRILQISLAHWSIAAQRTSRNAIITVAHLFR